VSRYLKRINYRPSEADLSEKELHQLQEHFAAYGAEAIVNGTPLPWSAIDEVEVAVAARAKGPSGWLVKNVLMGGDRYHVGFYSGQDELVVINVSRAVARHMVENIAYYAPQQVRYTGPDELAPTIDSQQDDQ
jgi:hypothetical protein